MRKLQGQPVCQGQWEVSQKHFNNVTNGGWKHNGGWELTCPIPFCLLCAWIRRFQMVATQLGVLSCILPYCEQCWLQVKKWLRPPDLKEFFPHFEFGFYMENRESVTSEKIKLKWLKCECGQTYYWVIEKKWLPVIILSKTVLAQNNILCLS